MLLYMQLIRVDDVDEVSKSQKYELLYPQLMGEHMAKLNGGRRYLPWLEVEKDCVQKSSSIAFLHVDTMHASTTVLCMTEFS